MKKIAVFVLISALVLPAPAFAVSPAAGLLQKHVKALSADIGPRSIYEYGNLERAARYIEDEFRAFGYEPLEQQYYFEKKEPQNKPFKNIIAVKEGASGKTIIVCCHYDSVKLAPGADDNATGVAAVLELARRLKDADLKKTVKFIAFSSEEMAEVVDDKEMGSFRYARNARKTGEDIEGVVCIDMIGYFSDAPGSQKRPILLAPFFPDKGNFIGMTSDLGSYGLFNTAVAEFSKSTDIPVQSLIAPPLLLPQVVTSDNRSFWTFGYPSVWISDTCIFRNPYQHTPQDTYDKLDYEKMAKVVDGIEAVVRRLAG